MHKRFLWLSNPSRLMVLSFALFILLCSGLLALPISQPTGLQPITWIDAFFTITSATCVTGLSVRDTGSDFSLFGQGLILLAIQCGGLGILTFSSLLINLNRQKMALSQRMLLETSHGLLPSVSPISLLKHIFLYTILIEGVGALLLTYHFAKEYTWPTALWMGTFHAVSAFCNAGFALLANNLIPYRDDLLLNGVIMSLIVLGGLGFVVFADLDQWLLHRLRGQRSRLSLHSRMVLRTTALLIGVATLLFALLEMDGKAMGEQSWEKLFQNSLFLSVTARTAGFNTVDIAQLTNPTLFLLVLLMAIGGSPGSTAGGIKTTTFATLTAMITSRIRNRPKVEYLDRSLADETLTKAMATAFGFASVMIVGLLLLQLTEEGRAAHNTLQGRTLDFLFEVTSALATVGLSTGITPTLSSAGKLVLIGLMFIGRLGPLLLATSLIGQYERIHYSYPEESINIG
ncbi:MAG: hypothetical protein HQL90_06140 [Magnetococcales bacterium]|nr:hypothetical protein [Magnetococcales bacterium]